MNRTGVAGRARTCALCHRVIRPTSVVVCGGCHQRAVDAFSKELSKLQGQLLTAKSSNALLSLFAEASCGSTH